jgi:hypothetical protein
MDKLAVVEVEADKEYQGLKTTSGSEIEVVCYVCYRGLAAEYGLRWG